MIKLKAFKKLLNIHHEAVGVLDRLDHIIANPVYNESAKRYWRECTNDLFYNIKEEWAENLHSLPEELMTRYLKYLYYHGTLFKEWMVEDLERLQAKLEPGNEYFDSIWRALTVSTSVIDSIFGEVERYNEIMSFDFNSSTPSSNRQPDDEEQIKGNTALRDGELTAEQKVVLVYYLDRFGIFPLNKISQDVTPQAVVLSSIFGLKWKRTYDRLRKPADLLTVKNLIPVLNIFKQHETTFQGIIQQIEKDLKNGN